MDVITAASETTILALDDPTIAGARRLHADGTAPNTKRAHQADEAYVTAWCQARGFEAPVPMSIEAAVTFVVDHLEEMPSSVERILVASGAKADFGQHSLQTVRRRISTIAVLHRRRGVPDPFKDDRLKELLKTASRAWTLRGNVPSKAAAIDAETLGRILATCGDDIAGIRDRALLTFAFASGGRRRSEVVGAVFERLVPVGLDYRYDMGLSKTNKTGEDDPKPIKGSAAVAMRNWLTASLIKDGPLFRRVWSNGRIGDVAMDGKSVALIVKHRVKLAGGDPEDFSGHSLRHGFMSECGYKGISTLQAMTLSGHKDHRTAMRYYRSGEVMRLEAADILG